MTSHAFGAPLMADAGSPLMQTPSPLQDNKPMWAQGHSGEGETSRTFREVKLIICREMPSSWGARQQVESEGTSLVVGAAYALILYLRFLLRDVERRGLYGNKFY